MYVVSLAYGVSNVQYRRKKKIQTKPSWNHLGEIRIQEEATISHMYIFDGPFKYVIRIQTAHIKICTGTQYMYVTLFCPPNGCYQQRVLLCIYWVTLCSSVSLIIRFLESISRVWTFLNLLGYVFLRAKHHETSRGGRDSFTSEIPQPFTNSPEYQWQQRVINFS